MESCLPGAEASGPCRLTARTNMSWAPPRGRPSTSSRLTGIHRAALATPPNTLRASSSRVRAPSRAAASAAPSPAGPPPATTTSYAAPAAGTRLSTKLRLTMLLLLVLRRAMRRAS